LAPLILLLVLISFALIYFSGLLGGKTSLESLRMQEESIRRAAVECYALEGYYPPSLSYLAERYGVSVDTGRYFVDYQYVASNLMPDITVLPVGQQP
jgi:hypothetical protein